MDNLEAAVLGGSLVTFLPGVTLEQRKAMRLAVRFARRATFDLMKEEAARPPSYISDEKRNLDLFDYYRRQLQFLGADGKTAGRPELDRKRVVDKALYAIQTVGGEPHASGMRQAFDALRNNPPALLHLTKYSKEQQGFQLIPCAGVNTDVIDMVVYFETGDLSAFDSTFLFNERKTTHFRAELVRFNTRIFDAEHRGKVERSLKSTSEKDICELPL